MSLKSIVSYRDLDAWQAAMDLLLATYPIAHQLPQTERFELASQMRRAAASVPSNVAEGQANGPGRRYHHHVRLALGSLGELDTLLEVATRLNYASDGSLRSMKEQLERTGQLLHRLERSLRRRLAVKCIVLSRVPSPEPRTAKI